MLVLRGTSQLALNVRPGYTNPALGHSAKGVDAQGREDFSGRLGPMVPAVTSCPR